LEDLGYVPRRAGTAAARGSTMVHAHGGELATRFAPEGQRQKLAERAKNLAVIDLDDAAENHLVLLSTGALSPLKGFLGSKDWLRVAREMRLENGLPWPLPITLSLPEAAHTSARIGEEVALRARDGRLVAILEVSDVFRPNDIGRGLKSPLGPEDAGRLLQAAGAEGALVGGEVHVFDEPRRVYLPGRDLTPRDTRVLFRSQGIQSIAAFSTTGLPRRAEEHLVKTALEITGAIWVQILRAAGDGEAAPFDVRARCHEAVLTAYFPDSRVVFSTGTETALARGARGAVLDALVAQNHGASHVVLNDAGAARVLSLYARSEIGIVPLCLERAFYSTVTGSMATTRTAPGDASTRWSASEAEIIAMIREGTTPQPEILRPEVNAIIAAWLQDHGPVSK
jgi:ATP sulfurylase